VTIDDFLRKALEPQRATRPGQRFINLLYEVKPSLAYNLKKLELDPYYVDRLLPSAIQYTVDNWDAFSPTDYIVGVDE
jgi:hypothetical protein